MLKVKSNARLNRRYLLIEGSKTDVEKAIISYVGTLGWAKASPMFVKEQDKKIILAINREEIDRVIGSFAISKNKINVLKVSGTLKGLSK